MYGASPNKPSVRISVPPQPSLQGLSIVWQAVASGPTTGFAASNPSFALIR